MPPAAEDQGQARQDEGGGDEEPVQELEVGNLLDEDPVEILDSPSLTPGGGIAVYMVRVEKREVRTVEQIDLEQGAVLRCTRRELSVRFRTTVPAEHPAGQAVIQQIRPEIYAEAASGERTPITASITVGQSGTDGEVRLTPWMALRAGSRYEWELEAEYEAPAWARRIVAVVEFRVGRRSRVYNLELPADVSS